MNCNDVYELLGNYIDEELTQAMAERIEEHVAGCAACARELSTLSSAVARLRSALPVEAPSAWHAKRLLERLAREHGTYLRPEEMPAASPAQLSLNMNLNKEEDR